jgi:hypothetical protein
MPLLKQGAPNAYVPPSRRPITTQPTVPGAPFDPAIVSVARPSTLTSTNSENHATSSKQPEQKSQVDAATDAANSTPAPPTIMLPSADTSAASSKPVTSTAKSIPSINAGKGATDSVERKVLDSFKQFSNTEKLRVQQHQRTVQERQRASARQEKSVKINDLKKFAENFKLYSRVPEDLVPILAKTKEKQKLIVTKAELQAREKEHKVTSAEASPAAVAPVKPDVPSSDASKAQPAPIQPARRAEPMNDQASPLTQRQRMNQNLRQNQPLPPRGPAGTHGMPPRPPQYRVPMANVQIPAPTAMPAPDLRSPPVTPAVPRDMTSPTTNNRLNVKAMEFRPNPAASNFTPTSPTKTSPLPAKRPSVSAASPIKFFSKKSDKPLSERTPLKDAFNPVKRMLEKTVADKKTEMFALNGGIPQPYRTPPTWDVAEGNKDKTYRDMFAQSAVVAVPAMHTPTNSVMAHSHQLPPHLQNGPSSNQPPRFYPAQPQHPGQHFDEARMQYGSNTPSVQPSPRLPHAMAYNGQMHPQMQHYPGGMPGYSMSPSMMRPMAAQQYGGPQGPPMGGHMMMQQLSNGPFMNGPMSQQVPMYASPGSGHVQPHFPGHSAPPPPGPAFGRGQPMSHQGSQQGHGQQMYMSMQQQQQQQHHAAQSKSTRQSQLGRIYRSDMIAVPQMRNFQQGQFQSGSPGQHGYPMQHRAMSNQGYNHNQMTPRQHHAAPHQGPSPGMPPMYTSGPGDEGK